MSHGDEPAEPSLTPSYSSFMNFRKIILGTALVALMSAVKAHASYAVEVGASYGVSALPVFTDKSADGSSFGAESSCGTAPCLADTVAPPLKTDVAPKGADDTLSELSDPETQQPKKDLAQTPADTARLSLAVDSIARKIGKPAFRKANFKPDPKRALWLSLVLPGAGQIYNRKFWKLPFIYGGFLGCAYALMWNQQMYRDYSQAYLDIMDDDPNTSSYLDMLPPRYDISGREEQFKSLFKRKKDYYRRYRDLSAFCFVGVYLLSVIDAYVDAQLSEFDITPDLSMSVKPAVIGNPQTLGGRSSSAYGVGCSLHF